MTEPVAALLSRASQLIELGRAEEALALLRRAIAAAPENSRAWCMTAQAEVAADRPSRALAAAERALALDPGAEWAHRLASLALGRQRRWHEAIQAAQEAVRLAPYEWRTHARIAEALAADPRRRHRRARRRQARQHASRAVTLAPLAPDSHSALGRVLLDLDKPRKAESAFREALRLDPLNAAARNALGVATLRRGDPVSAVAHFGASLAAQPQQQIPVRNLEAALWGTVLRAVMILVFAQITLVDATMSAAAAIPRIAIVLCIVLLPTAFVARKWPRLPRHLKRYVLRLPLKQFWLITTIAVCVANVVLIVTAAILPHAEDRHALATAGKAAAGLAFVTGIVGVLRFRRTLQPRG
jgi:tetratricopeptide (TPR) repeat protein